MRTAPAALPFLLAAVLCACSREAQPRTRALLDSAAGLASRGDHLEAARMLRAGLAGVAPADRGRVLLATAGHYHRAGLHLDCLEQVEACLREGASGSEALYLQGESLRLLQRQAEAERILAGLVARDPSHRLGQLSLGCLRFRSSEPGQALPHFESYFRGAVPDEPRHDEALLEHGRALRASGRFADAADRFLALIEKDPLADAAPYSELASTLYRLGLRKEGRFVEEVYRRMSEGTPGQEVEKGLRESGETVPALLQRAQLALRARRFLRAFQSYREAIRRDPADPRPRLALAELCLRFRRPRDAREVLEEGLARNPPAASGLWWMLARVQVEERDFPAALRSTAAAIAAREREGPGNTAGGEGAPGFSLRLVRARAAFETGDLAGAREAAREAAEELPGSWEPCYWLGRTELARGSATAALVPFDEALSRGGGEVSEVRLWKALALRDTGRREEARSELTRLLQSNPGYLPTYQPLLELFREEDPAKRAGMEKAFAGLKRLRGDLEALEREAAAVPLEGSAGPYLKLVKLHLRLKDSAAPDLLFLLGELVPGDREVLRLLLAGTTQPQDLFVRLHLLRRLEKLEPSNPQLLGDLAEIYLKLRLRAGEAAGLAERLHGLAPSPRSYRLLGELALLRGEKAPAAAILRRGLEAHPADATLREALSRAEAPASAPSEAAGTSRNP